MEKLTKSAMGEDLAPENFAQCPLLIAKHDTIQLSHGSGGKMMNNLISKLFLSALENSDLCWIYSTNRQV